MEENTNENDENKKSNDGGRKVTITLSTLALGIICVILLIAAVTLLFTQTKISKENDELRSTLAELSFDNHRMLKLIENNGLEELLEYDEIEKVDNFSNNYGYDSKAAENFTEDQVRQSITEYMEIYNLFNYQFDKLLIKLDLMSEYEEERLLYEIDYSNQEYIQTNISYEDFKNAMLKYMTDITFQNTFEDLIRSKDGKLCFSIYNVDCDLDKYEIISIEKDSDFSKNNGYKVTYSVTYEYEDYDFDTGLSSTEIDVETDSSSFVVTSFNGNCIISYSDF